MSARAAWEVNNINTNEIVFIDRTNVQIATKANGIPLFGEPPRRTPYSAKARPHIIFIRISLTRVK
jgi:hypothetical protein